MSRKVYNIDYERELQRIITPSIFDQLINEIDPTEVPVEYIERVVVHYKNGNVVELSGNEINHPVPINRNGKWSEMDKAYKTLKEVKVFINTEKLENDVNWMVKLLMDGRC